MKRGFSFLSGPCRVDNQRKIDYIELLNFDSEASHVCGGKNWREDVIRVEKLEGKIGDPVKLNDVLMVSDGVDTRVGEPQLSEVVVTGEIVQQAKSAKTLIFKMKRRKNYRRLRGHRQNYTTIKINDIQV
jgi:large subunit ribosomal protein L21